MNGFNRVLKTRDSVANAPNLIFYIGFLVLRVIAAELRQ